MRDECLTGEITCPLKEAQITFDQWREEYNTGRRHSA
ncbi:MAG: transposase [Acidobacteria bacterium]|nr:transposase [Acidobacteriota bacterium]